MEKNICGLFIHMMSVLHLHSIDLVRLKIKYEYFMTLEPEKQIQMH